MMALSSKGSLMTAWLTSSSVNAKEGQVHADFWKKLALAAKTAV